MDRTSDPAEVLPRYVEFLKGYLARGGTPGAYRDVPFAEAGFEFVGKGAVQVDSDNDFGRRLLVAKGVTVERTDPGHEDYSGWAASTVYSMDRSTVIAGSSPDFYADPVFQPMVPFEVRMRYEDQLAEDLSDGRIGWDRYRELTDPGPQTGRTDDDVLRTLSGATFSGEAQLHLPSGDSLDAQTAQAWTAAFGPEDDSAVPRAGSAAPPARGGNASKGSQHKDRPGHKGPELH